MKYICTLLVVEHMERSKQFYREVLGQEVVSDLGANVTLSCGPFYSPDAPCAIYQCAVLERGNTGCGGCQALPCAIWRATRDPQFTDEAFEENIRERMNNLEKAEARHL